jgi:hypothetical protein
VLVVHGVKLAAFDHPHQVREFQCDDSACLEGDAQSGNEVVDVGHMRADIVADEKVCRETLGRKLNSEMFAEEFASHRNAERLRHGCRACRRLDAETGNSGLHEMTKQITIVRSDFDDLAVLSERESRTYRFEIACRVREPGAGRRRKIRVIGCEQLLGRGVVARLHKPAPFADIETKRICRFRRIELFAAQVGVRRRSMAEVEEEMLELRRAMTAPHPGSPAKSTPRRGS